jgi:hypothetical protein
MLFQERDLRLGIGRRAADDDLAARHRIAGGRRLDHPHQAPEVRPRGEGGDLAPAGGEEHARSLGQRGGGGLHVGNGNEAVGRVARESRPQQLGARHAGQLGRFRRMGGDARRERMGGVDQRVVALLPQEGGEPVGSAEAAAPHFSGQRGRHAGQAGQRGDRLQAVVTGKPRRELRRFRRPAEDEEPSHARFPPAAFPRDRR